MKKRLFIAAGLLALLIAPFLGGSVLQYLGGANSLDIVGIAKPVGRPADTIDVGQGWSSYGSDDGGHRYSRLATITPANVHELEIAWEYSTGDLLKRPDLMLRSATEGTPILVENSLIFCTPFNEVIALDPEDRAERWRFDAETDPE